MGLDLVSVLSGDQRRLSKKIAPFLGSTIGKGQPAFEGDRIAGLSPFQRDAITAGQQASAGFGSRFAPTRSALERVSSGRPTFDLGPEEVEGFINKNIIGPRVKNFNEFTVPGLNAQFRGPGTFFSSAKARGLERAGADLGSSIGADSSAARLGLLDRQIGLQQGADQLALAGGNALQGLFNSESRARNEAIALSEIGRQEEQSRLDVGFSEFLRTLPINDPALAHALNFIGQTHVAGVEEAESGLLGSAIGAGGSIIGSLIAAGVFGGG